jgi:Na+/melibiose symporter-like transporter
LHVLADYQQFRRFKSALSLHAFGKKTLDSKIQTIVLKLGLTIGSALVAKILGSYGYIPGLENGQTEVAIQGTKMLVSMFPAIPFLIGVVLLFFYEINKEMESQIEIDLKQRRIN